MKDKLKIFVFYDVAIQMLLLPYFGFHFSLQKKSLNYLSSL